MKANQKSKLANETKQVGKFGLIGIINTLLDFTIYNVMILTVGLAIIPSNIISTSVAMTFSFLANKTFVFHSRSKEYFKQATLFLTVTAFGLYIVQNSVIFTLIEVWQWPLDFGYLIVQFLGLDSFMSREFVFANGAKAIGTIFSMTWNYLFYKKVVFKK